MFSAGGALLQLKQILNSIAFSVVFIWFLCYEIFLFWFKSYSRALSHELYYLIFASVFMLKLGLIEICINFITVMFFFFKI